MENSHPESAEPGGPAEINVETWLASESEWGDQVEFSQNVGSHSSSQVEPLPSVNEIYGYPTTCRVENISGSLQSDGTYCTRGSFTLVMTSEVGIGEGPGLPTEDISTRAGSSSPDDSLDEVFMTLAPLESRENVGEQPDLLDLSTITFDNFEEFFHVQPASPIILYQYGHALMATSQEPHAQSSRHLNAESPVAVQVPGADSLVVRGESLQDGDSLNQSFHLNNEASNFTRRIEDSTLAGCSMDQTRTRSPQGNAVRCQPELYVDPVEGEAGRDVSLDAKPRTKRKKRAAKSPQVVCEPELCVDLVEGEADRDVSLDAKPRTKRKKRATKSPKCNAVCQPELCDLVEGEADRDGLDANPRTKRKKRVALPFVGVSRRYNGLSHSFEANYAPPGSNGKVFLGEYSTQEEAKDAYNLVALLHEGTGALVDLHPYTVEKYVHELQEWQGKHQVDLVCELRLKGRGVHKDGSKDYKHVNLGCLSERKTKLSFEAKVSYEHMLPNGTKKRKTTSKTFDTAEQAAQYADMVEVEHRGKYAWTNFPLSMYISDLDKDFLPTQVTTRIDREYKRATGRQVLAG